MLGYPATPVRFGANGSSSEYLLLVPRTYSSCPPEFICAAFTGFTKREWMHAWGGGDGGEVFFDGAGGSFCFPSFFPSCLGMKVKRHDDRYFPVFMIHLASWNAHFLLVFPGLPLAFSWAAGPARVFTGVIKRERKKVWDRHFSFSLFFGGGALMGQDSGNTFTCCYKCVWLFELPAPCTLYVFHNWPGFGC